MISLMAKLSFKPLFLYFKIPPIDIILNTALLTKHSFDTSVASLKSVQSLCISFAK